MNRVEREEHILRIKELEIDLYSNRSDKLKLMHENAQLKRKNNELIEAEAFSRADCVVARKELLDKLQLLDNICNDYETLKRTLYIQNEEMMNMSGEVFTSKQSYVSISNEVVDMENMTLEYNKTIDVLQHEISRLRKELMFATTDTTTMLSPPSDNYSHSSSLTSLPSTTISSTRASGTAATAYGTMSRSANRVSTAITNSAYNDGLDGPYTSSRRPMTLHGLSRERNREMTAGSRDAMSYTASPLRSSHSGTMTTNNIRTGTSNSSSNHHQQQQQYHYVDLQEQLQKDLVDRSSTRSSINLRVSSHQSQRNDMLKQYDDAIFEFNRTINNNNNNAISNHSTVVVNSELNNGYDGITIHSPSSSIVSGDIDNHHHRQQHHRSSSSSSNSSNTKSASSFMCSPISTPHRPINTPIASPASSTSMHHQKMNMNIGSSTTTASTTTKILPTSINNRPNTVVGNINTNHRGRDGDSNSSSIDGSSKMISKSLNDLKKCYSMPSIHHNNTKQKKDKGYRNSISIETLDPITTSSTTITSPVDASPSSTHGNDSPLPININDEAGNRNEHGQYNEEHHRGDLNNDEWNNQATTENNAVDVTRIESLDDDVDELLLPISTSQVKSKQRTLYVGSGLGLKHNEVLNSQLESLNIGSAQYKLKKILGDRFD